MMAKKNRAEFLKPRNREPEKNTMVRMGHSAATTMWKMLDKLEAFLPVMVAPPTEMPVVLPGTMVQMCHQFYLSLEICQTKFRLAKFRSDKIKQG